MSYTLKWRWKLADWISGGGWMLMHRRAEIYKAEWMHAEDRCDKYRARLADAEAMAEALRLALDYVEGCKANNLPDLGSASRLPFMDDVLRIGDATLEKWRAGK